MCECITKLAKEDYVFPDYFHSGVFMIYPIKWNNGVGKVGKMGVLLNYCPICGEKMEWEGIEELK